MKTDASKKKLIEFYEELSPAKKLEALDFIKWLWVSKESQFIGKGDAPDWLKKLYFSFAAVRQETKRISSRKVDADIKKAIKEVR